MCCIHVEHVISDGWQQKSTIDKTFLSTGKKYIYTQRPQRHVYCLLPVECKKKMLTQYFVKKSKFYITINVYIYISNLIVNLIECFNLYFDRAFNMNKLNILKVHFSGKKNHQIYGSWGVRRSLKFSILLQLGFIVHGNLTYLLSSLQDPGL